MNITRIVCIIALGGVVVASGVEAGSYKTERIVGKHIKAVGGKKLRTIETVKVTGGVTVMGFDTPFTLLMKRPHRTRMEMKMMGRDIVQAFDGETAWWINPFLGAGKPTKMPDDFTRQLMRWTSFESPLIDYRKKRNRVNYMGKVDGSHHMHVRTAGGDELDMYLSSENYLEVRRSYEETYAGKARRVDTRFSDYRSIDGIMIPHTIGGVDVRGEPFAISIRTWEFNVAIDDASFRMPEHTDKTGIRQVGELCDLIGIFNRHDFPTRADYGMTGHRAIGDVIPKLRVELFAAEARNLLGQ